MCSSLAGHDRQHGDSPQTCEELGNLSMKHSIRCTSQELKPSGGISIIALQLLHAHTATLLQARCWLHCYVACNKPPPLPRLDVITGLLAIWLCHCASLIWRGTPNSATSNSALVARRQSSKPSNGASGGPVDRAHICSLVPSACWNSRNPRTFSGMFL